MNLKQAFLYKIPFFHSHLLLKMITYENTYAVNEAELERLKNALKLLSEAEKHLRVSSERSSWFTATLLQLSSVPSPDPNQPGSSRRQSSRTSEDPLSTCNDVIAQKLRPDPLLKLRRSTSPVSLHRALHRNSFSEDDLLSLNSKPAHELFMNGDSLSVSDDNFVAETLKSNMLDDIWIRCIGRCHSKTLRHLLRSDGKLVLISKVEGTYIMMIQVLRINHR